MITFKENTFVKGNYEELIEMAKDIEEKGGKIEWNINRGDKRVNHLFWSNLGYWCLSKIDKAYCHNELTKSQLYEAYGIIDFSILNEKDVFYVETKNGSTWLFQGDNLVDEGKGVHISLNTGNIYNQKIMTSKSRIKSIRLATPQEIEPYKEHFKLNNMETRPIQISKEIATRWYNGEDNELKQLAIQTFPELDEATPKVGDLCLFSDHEEELNNNIGQTGEFDGYSFNGSFKRKYGCTWRYCKKIKSIEFYD